MTDSDELRIGTVEREAAVKILGDHMAAGRLSLDEYEERAAAALESRTRADIRPLFEDLPAPYPAFMTPPAPYAYAPAPVGHAPAPPPSTESYRLRVVAGVLQIVLPFGVGRFYTGHTGIAVAQLLTSLIGIGVIWSIIDGIIILATGGTDVDGRRLQT
ncbi:MAG: DUF1707 domain-containing protein [Actinophytocola sp.]|uniref:DUF1707 domain-containing protein n=1 Tax=Actinophytocola sp. TaxID=1872138 RepID=UPI003C70E4AA